jgi:hypothetical protein
LLIAGPFFLIIGTHPGFGRVVAMRWVEMIIGVLLKQVAVAIVLSVLLYAYSLIMGTSDTSLPWALKILMIALVTVAVFIYRKPFTHLFSAVGYGALGSDERADYSLRQARSTFRRNTVEAAAVAIPGMAGARAARWARLIPAQGVAAGAAAAADAAAGTGTGAAAGTGTGAGAAGDAYPSRFRPEAPPPADADGETSPGAGRGTTTGGLSRARELPEAEGSTGRTPPPLDLPPRNGAAGSGLANAAGTSSHGTRRPATPGPTASRVRATSGGSPGSAPARSAPPAGGTSGTAGTTSHQAAPSWPLSSWSGAGPGGGARQRSAAERRPAERGSAASPAEPPRSNGSGSDAGSGSGGASGSGEPKAMPFWLRPRRRS